MSDNIQESTRNAFLCLLEKLAGARKQPLEEFAVSFHFTREGIQMLREYPWLYPSAAMITILRDEIELTEDESWELSELQEAGFDPTLEAGINELTRIYELLPMGYCTSVMNVARKQMEIYFCFEGHEFPNSSLDTDYDEEDE